MVRNFTIIVLPGSIPTVISSAGLQAIEKGRRRQHTRIRVGFARKFVVFQINVRIEQVAKQRVNLHRVTHFFLQLGLFLGKVGPGKIRAGDVLSAGLGRAE